MTKRIPVYEQTFGDGHTILKTTAEPVVADVPVIITRLGSILAPAGTVAWPTSNGIDVHTTRQAFDLVVAMYYAEHNLRGLKWEEIPFTVAAS